MQTLTRSNQSLPRETGGKHVENGGKGEIWERFPNSDLSRRTFASVFE